VSEGSASKKKCWEKIKLFFHSWLKKETSRQITPVTSRCGHFRAHKCTTPWLSTLPSITVCRITQELGHGRDVWVPSLPPRQQLGELEWEQPEASPLGERWAQPLQGRVPRQAPAPALIPKGKGRSSQSRSDAWGCHRTAGSGRQAPQTSLGLVSLRYGCKVLKIHGPSAQVYARRFFPLCVYVFVEFPLSHLEQRESEFVLK